MIFFLDVGMHFLILISIQTVFTSVSSDAKASHLSNIPVASSESREFDDYPNYDADIKIPGRHIPKRPYVDHVRDDSRSRLGLVSSTDSDYAKHPYQRFEPSKDQPQGDSQQPQMGPYFDRTLTRNVTVQAGKTAELTCKVQELSKKSVSWIRLRDLHILTVDRYKYSTNMRVSIDYEENTQTWLLKISDTKHSDAGKYECQVSTRPVLSFIVNLDVVVPKAYIVNSPDIHVHRGSLVNLTCVVNHGINQPVYVYWYHQNQLVDIDDGRRNVEMSTQLKGQTVSQLLVNRARLEDSGKYICKPSNGDSAPVTLHVLRGEQQAAMQTNRGAKSFHLWVSICSGIFLFFLL